MPGIPIAQIDVTAERVSALLRAQHPDLGDLPLSPLASGFDNVMFRLGERYVVRMPRRAVGAQLLVNEQRWLPVLAPHLPVAISAPLLLGQPGPDYPWHWSVLPWFEGSCADVNPPGTKAALTFAQFLLQLHQPAPLDAPFNPVRGGPLTGRLASFEERFARVSANTDTPSADVQRLWQRGLAAPVSAHRTWLHGDLHAQNVLIQQGRISAIIDWGDITAGDVATDLQSIWALFPKRRDREKVLSAYAPEQSVLDRAMAWAVLMAVVMIDTGMHGSRRHEKQGRLQLARLLADC
ncbi:MAG: aminoglycoside phosphotransferase family protein [bacterium]